MDGRGRGSTCSFRHAAAPAHLGIQHTETMSSGAKVGQKVDGVSLDGGSSRTTYVNARRVSE